MELSNRVALVTGGGSGLGLATTKTLAESEDQCSLNDQTCAENQCFPTSRKTVIR